MEMLALDVSLLTHECCSTLHTHGVQNLKSVIQGGKLLTQVPEQRK